MSEKSSSNVKKRNWVFVLYPESAPANWREILQATGLPCAISPLHDKDLNATGEPKKAHHHIILAYPGPTTYNVVSSLTASLNQPIPQPLDSVRGYYRYFTHKDNPEKAQYDELDITTLNGFNISDYVELTKSEVDSLIFDIQKLCRELCITEYSDLCDYLQDNEMRLYHSIVTSHTLFFDRYLTSKRFKRSNREEHSDE